MFNNPVALQNNINNVMYGVGNHMTDRYGETWVRGTAHKASMQRVRQQQHADIFNDPIMKTAYYQSLFFNPQKKGFFKAPTPDGSGWTLGMPGLSYNYRNDGSVYESIVAPGALPKQILPSGSINFYG